MKVCFCCFVASIYCFSTLIRSDIVAIKAALERDRQPATSPVMVLVAGMQAVCMVLLAIVIMYRRKVPAVSGYAFQLECIFPRHLI